MKRRNLHPIWIKPSIIICCAISLISLGISLYATCNRDIDLTAFVISTLSVLVTVLIGWNIFTLIDLSSERKDLKEVKGGIELTICRRALENSSLRAVPYFHEIMFPDNRAEKNLFNFYYSTIQILHDAAKIDSTDVEFGMIKQMQLVTDKAISEHLKLFATDKEYIMIKAIGMRICSDREAYRTLIRRMEKIEIIYD